MKITVAATAAQEYEIPDDLWEMAMSLWNEDSSNAAKEDVEAGVREWFLKSQSPALAWRSPVQVLKEDVDGHERVKQVLGAIMYGVYL